MARRCRARRRRWHKREPTPGEIVDELAVHQATRRTRNTHRMRQLATAHLLIPVRIFSLILVALILSRDWVAFTWVASGLIVFGLFRLGLDKSSSAMGALGTLLLFGGLATCLWVALRRKRPARESSS